MIISCLDVGSATKAQPEPIIGLVKEESCNVSTVRRRENLITRYLNPDVPLLLDKIRYLLEKANQSFEVKNLAGQIVTGKSDPIVAIHDWTHANFKYIPDPDNKELFISPDLIAKEFNKGMDIAGDCDDHAILNCALFRAVGIPAYILILDMIGNGWDHAVCQVQSKHGWITCDTSSHYPLGWEYHYVKKLEVG